MDIEKFSRQTIEKYKENTKHMGSEDAKRQAIYASSVAAAERERLPIHDTARAARHAIEAYQAKTKGGLSEGMALEDAARDTANRFDGRARDGAARSQEERPKSRGMSL